MELHSLCATVIKKTGFGMIKILRNFNVGDVGDAKTGLISVKSRSELRELLIFTAKPVKTG